MNADVRATKTPAEQALSAAFEAARDTLPGKGMVADLREDAFRRFKELADRKKLVDERDILGLMAREEEMVREMS